MAKIAILEGYRVPMARRSGHRKSRRFHGIATGQSLMKKCGILVRKGSYKKMATCMKAKGR